jgi:hypothetical protein
MADAFIGFDARYRKLDTNEIEGKSFGQKASQRQAYSK